MKIYWTRLIASFFGSVFLLLGFCLGEGASFDQLKGHGETSAGEQVDLYNGNLKLSYLDVALPGVHGLDLNIWRVYNSKLLKDKIDNRPGSVRQQDPYSWVGWGWNIHMGYVVIPPDKWNIDGLRVFPVTIHFPDGREEEAYPSDMFNCDKEKFVTSEFLTYNRIRHELYFPDGTVWCFGQEIVPTDPLMPTRRYVTNIHNCLADEISIQYCPDWPQVISRIVDSYGRVVSFQTRLCGHGHLNGSENTPVLTTIAIKNTGGESVAYNYNIVDIGDDGTCHQLESFQPPILPATQYIYNDHHELSRIELSTGGEKHYEYADHFFWCSEFNDPEEGRYSRVLSRRTECPGACSSASPSWDYCYPTNNLFTDHSGTTTVVGPLFTMTTSFFAIDNNSDRENYWKRGLIKEEAILEGASIVSKTSYEWDSFQLTPWNSDFNFSKSGQYCPLLIGVTQQKQGDAPSAKVMSYDTSNTWSAGRFGLPGSIEEYASGVLQKRIRLTYYYESNSLFRQYHLLAPLKEEIVESGDGEVVGRTQYDYYLCGYSGHQGCKLGLVSSIKRWVDDAHYRLWSFDYVRCYRPDGFLESVTVSTTKPNGGVEQREYAYGVESKFTLPSGHVLYSRNINQYTSNIVTETSQDGATFTYSYDDLGRICGIDYPAGFNGITVNWGDKQATITQGDHIITRYWDGLGRDRGYDDNDGRQTLHFRKFLDAEGRVVSENKGSTSTSSCYAYNIDPLGRAREIVNPKGEVTQIAYHDRKKTVTDPLLRRTEFTFSLLPGKASRVTDPQGHHADYTYDSLGRLIRAAYSPAAPAHDDHVFAYNWLDQITHESHPETGLISYQYNDAGSLEKKVWGDSAINYQYNNSDQLEQTQSADQTISYRYDNRGRIQEVDGPQSSRTIAYNCLGAIASETQTVHALNKSFTIQYQYDGNNNLWQVKYPSGRRVEYTVTGVGLPTSLSGTASVSDINYGIGGMPISLKYGLNGAVTMTNGYDPVGRLTNTKYQLTSSGKVIYRADYSRDAVGNITAIDNTTPALDAGFVYDNLDRLRRAEYSGTFGAVYQYDYDPYGNMTLAQKNTEPAQSYTYTGQNRFSGPEYTYDARGNLRRYYLADIAMNNIWDKENRLISVQDDQGAKYAENAYDERDLRLVTTRAVPGFAVTCPTAGDHYARSEDVQILWNPNPSSDTVKIEYTRDGGDTWSTIADPVENNGKYHWTTPSSKLEDSPHCKIRITEKYGLRRTVTSGEFLIGWGDLIFRAPVTGDEFRPGSVASIRWTYYGDSPTVSIGYNTINSNTEYTPLTGGEAVPSGAGTAEWQGVFAWTVPNTPSDRCRLRVTSLDGQSTAHSEMFTINGIRIVTPNGGESLKPGRITSIQWLYFGSCPPAFTVDYSVDGGVTWVSPAIADNIGGTTHNWTVPAAPSTNCRVRVRGNGLSDMSDQAFTIVPLAIEFPKGGEILRPGSVATIKWKYYGAQNPSFQLFLSTDNGATFTSLTPSPLESSTRSYSWTVPDSPSDVCRIRITSSDGVSDLSDGPFTISGIRVTCPNGGENLKPSTPYKIDWRYYGSNSTTFAIELSLDGGMNYHTLVDSLPNHLRTYSWTPGNQLSTDCLLRLSTSDNLTDTSDSVFTIGGLGLVEPAGHECLSPGGVYSIRWTYYGQQNPTFQLAFSSNGGATYTSITPAPLATNTRSFDWVVPNVASTDCLLKVSSSDGLSATNVYPFSIMGLNLVSPNGGEYFTQGATTEIRWIYSGNSDDKTLTVEYSLDNGTNYTVIGNNLPSQQTALTWTVPAQMSDKVLIRISSSDGLTDVSDGCAVIRGVRLDAPAGGRILKQGNTCRIRWTYYGSPSTTFRLEYALSGRTSAYTTIVSGLANSVRFYDWTVPAQMTEQCFIKITASDGLSDVNSTAIIISGIQLTAPNTAVSLVPGSTTQIQWTYCGSKTTTFTLDYSKDSGAHYLPIAAGLLNSQRSYAWTVPSTASNNWRVRVRSIEDGLNDDSNAAFTIQGPEITTPALGESLRPGTSYVIRWNYWGTPDATWTYEYSTNNGTTWQLITSQSGSTRRSYYWASVPNEPSPNCLVRVTNSSGLRGVSERFNIVGLSVSNPAAGMILTKGSTCSIQWQAYGSVGNVAIKLYKNSGTYVGTVTSSVSGTAGTYEWAVPNLINGATVAESDYQQSIFYLRITEVAPGTATAESTGRFTIRQNSALLSSPRPAAVASGARIDLGAIGGRFAPVGLAGSGIGAWSIGVSGFGGWSEPTGSQPPPAASGNPAGSPSSEGNLEPKAETTGRPHEPAAEAATRDSQKEASPSAASVPGEVVTSYSVYSADRKLLAEYNSQGECLREYVYAGNQLIGEYRPQLGKTLYYVQDPTHSTRMITTETGDLKYSAAYSPYGETMATWDDTLLPHLAFAGSERDHSLAMDYFAARYYGIAQHRFFSVDPNIRRQEAFSRPDLWNLYAYCRNNPIGFLDANGREEFPVGSRNWFLARQNQRAAEMRRSYMEMMLFDTSVERAMASIRPVGGTPLGNLSEKEFQGMLITVALHRLHGLGKFEEIGLHVILEHLLESEEEMKEWGGLFFAKIDWGKSTNKENEKICEQYIKNQIPIFLPPENEIDEALQKYIDYLLEHGYEYRFNKKVLVYVGKKD